MAEPLKYQYSPQWLMALASSIAGVHPSFSVTSFLATVQDERWPVRELKERMHHIRGCLQNHIALSYSETVSLICRVAPGFTGLTAMVFPDFIEAYGLERWDVSIPALAWLTQFSSSEFAVRPFILKDAPRMMAQMQVWAGHESEHVRRLASEGCRPRLPWAMALPDFKRDPAPIWPILERLIDDPSTYVRRSVANNLNDISKDHPDQVLEFVARHQKRSESARWICKHGSRTLLKQGHADALRLHGYEDVPHIAVTIFELDKDCYQIGENFTLTVGLETLGYPLGALRLEYAVDYAKGGGKSSRKVFKLAEGRYQEVRRTMHRSHSLAQMSTRRHYPGRHRVSLLLNGECRGELFFDLTT